VRAAQGDPPGAAVAGPQLSAPFRWLRRDGLVLIEAELPAGRAVFSTRAGGRSDGPYRSLNLGILTEDDSARVAQNRELLASALDRDPSGFAMGLQVHGAKVERRSRPPRASAYVQRGTRLTRADAQVTDDPGVTPLVLVADCVPLVLSAPRAVAVAHCGWRGVSAGLVPNAVEAVRELARDAGGGLSAALGPGIGACCYEVGDEVRDAFEARGHRAVFDGPRLDLAAAIRHELEQTGVKRGSIWDSGLCTSCQAELFFSHRRDAGVTGRQAGIAWLEP
jgi:YfiH family protein